MFLGGSPAGYLILLGDRNVNLASAARPVSGQRRLGFPDPSPEDVEVRRMLMIVSMMRCPCYSPPLPEPFPQRGKYNQCQPCQDDTEHEAH